jgi:hypothetical protein
VGFAGFTAAHGAGENGVAGDQELAAKTIYEITGSGGAVAGEIDSFQLQRSENEFSGGEGFGFRNHPDSGGGEGFQTADVIRVRSRISTKWLDDGPAFAVRSAMPRALRYQYPGEMGVRVQILTKIPAKWMNPLPIPPLRCY